jgi:hypothetical protein
MDITGVVDTGKFCFAGVIDTGKEFLRSVIDNSEALRQCVDTGEAKKIR